MLLFLLPASSLPPHLLEDLKTADQSFPSHLVSIFHYSLLFHLKKVSLQLSCSMLLLICHQFIQLLHIQLTDTRSAGLPLKQMLHCTEANIEEKNNSQSLMLEAQDEAHLKPVFFWISKAKYFFCWFIRRHIWLSGWQHFQQDIFTWSKLYLTILLFVPWALEENKEYNNISVTSVCFILCCSLRIFQLRISFCWNTESVIITWHPCNSLILLQSGSSH